MTCVAGSKWLQATMTVGVVLGGFIVGFLSTSCSASHPTREQDLYLSDATFRRAALVHSLVNPTNGYSALRLAHYDTNDPADWSRLPEWNPRVEGVAARELDASGGARSSTPLGANAQPLGIDDAALRAEDDALVTLGEAAFFRYPVQTSFTTETATVSRKVFASYGFWVDDARGAGGLVREETPSGAPIFAYTCATCHCAVRGGALVVGVGNDRLDLGKLAVDASIGFDASVADPFLAWGPGRLDVTTADGLEPVRIADLRPVRWLTHLQADATVAHSDRTALAIRIETLIVTSHGQRVRPPRVVALGLAAYIESLAEHLPSAPPQTDAELRGASLFQATCAGCHIPPAFTGLPVPLQEVGTDPHLGMSSDRGTGAYRVPSLHGVRTRGSLLHDASLPGLDAMFDPARVSAGYQAGRLGPGAVVGHPFGLGLGEGELGDLLAYLGTL